MMKVDRLFWFDYKMPQFVFFDEIAEHFSLGPKQDLYFRVFEEKLL